MEVLYGHEAEVSIESRPGRGTKVVLVMPILDSGAGPWAELGAVAQVGWGAAMKAISRGVMVAGAPILRRTVGLAPRNWSIQRLGFCDTFPIV